MENRFYTRKDQYREKFFRLPMVLVFGEKYKQMKDRTRVAYAILLNRQEVSLKNEWYDEQGNIYFKYGREQLADVLQMTPKTVTSIRKELVELKLLVIKRMGQGLTDRLYLQRPEVTEVDIYEIDNSEENTGEDLDDKKPVGKLDKKEGSQTVGTIEKGKSYTSRKVENTHLDVTFLPPNKNKGIKKKINKTNLKDRSINNRANIEEEITNLDVPISVQMPLVKNKDRLIDDEINIYDIEVLFKANQDQLNEHQFSQILNNVLAVTNGKIKNISNLMQVSIGNYQKGSTQEKTTNDVVDVNPSKYDFSQKNVRKNQRVAPKPKWMLEQENEEMMKVLADMSESAQDGSHSTN